MLESRQEMLTREIRPSQWKVLLYTNDGSTVSKRIWLAAQVADKWACKSAQSTLLESENISIAAGDSVFISYKASYNHLFKS